MYDRIPMLMKALVWPVATYGCESWTLRKNEEARLDAFELQGLRKKTRELFEERDYAVNNARCTQERKTTYSLDGQHQDVEESIRMTEDRNKWIKYVHVVVNPRIEDS